PTPEKSRARDQRPRSRANRKSVAFVWATARTGHRMVSMSTTSNNDKNPAAHDPESFAALFEEESQRHVVKEGDIVKGKVIHIGKDDVVVDIGYKSEGTIPLYEFTQADGTIGIKEGDEIDVFLESREDENGLCVLSKEKADRLKVWDEISGAC